MRRSAKSPKATASTISAHSTCMANCCIGRLIASAVMKNAAVSASTSLFEMRMVKRSDDAAIAMATGKMKRANVLMTGSFLVGARLAFKCRHDVAADRVVGFNHRTVDGDDGSDDGNGQQG